MGEDVQARGLTVRHGPVVALQDVELDVAAGTFLAVTAESGAGKSTLLWALAGRAAYDGEVAAPRAALLPQSLGLAAILTARENVAAPLLSGVFRCDGPWRRAGERLAEVGLDGFEDHLIDELSGGQQQRVAVARLLATEAPLLLADEPTAALDHANARRVVELLTAAARGGATVVMTTNDDDVAALADAEVRLDEGRLSWVRRPRATPAG